MGPGQDGSLFTISTEESSNYGDPKEQARNTYDITEDRRSGGEPELQGSSNSVGIVVDHWNFVEL